MSINPMDFSSTNPSKIPSANRPVAPGDRRQAGQSLQCRSFTGSKCVQHPCRITGAGRGMAVPSGEGVENDAPTGLPNLGKFWDPGFLVWGKSV